MPFYSPKNPKNQNFAKIKKTVGDIIILHMSMINENHMRYVPWHVTDRIFCNFGLFFAFKKKTTRFTPCKVEQPLQCIELQEKEAQKENSTQEI